MEWLPVTLGDRPLLRQDGCASEHKVELIPNLPIKMYDPLSQLTHCCKRVTASGDCSGMGVAKARAGAAGMTPDAIASLEWRDLQTEKDRYKITEKHTEQGTTARRVILPSTVIQPYTCVYMNVYALSGVHVPKTYCAGCQPCKRTLYILTDHVCKDMLTIMSSQHT